MAKKYRTVLLRSGRDAEPNQKEAKVVAAGVMPGMVSTYANVGGDLQIGAHGVAGGDGPFLWPMENALGGDDIDTAYVGLEQAQYLVCGLGDEVAARLVDDVSIAAGDKLESAGNGYLQALSSGGVAVGTAMEAVDTTTSESEAGTQIRVEIL